MMHSALVCLLLVTAYPPGDARSLNSETRSQRLPLVSGTPDAIRAAAAAQQVIKAWHAGDVPDQPPMLRVVYFVPRETPPQKAYKERLTRILLDVQDFYRDEMRRNGFSPADLALEMEDDAVRLHLVQGEHPADAYSYTSGGKIEAEIAKSLAGVVDLRHDYVLVLHGLCRTVGDNHYVFSAPYYGHGGSSQRWGLCHAADCELLDPWNLVETTKTMEYDEHAGHFSRTWADFNTVYLGGIVHELGHGLGLPHDRENKREHDTLGTSLMGAGNYTYRRERWNGGKGSFLTLASSVRLAAHPLFTGRTRGRDLEPQAELADLQFEAAGRTLSITGKLRTDIPCYAVLAYVDGDEPQGDYDALTLVSAVEDGTFRINAPEQESGSFTLRIVTCHVNGATTTIHLPYRCSSDGVPDAARLQDDWTSRRIEELAMTAPEDADDLARTLLAGETSPLLGRKLRHLQRLLHPSPPVALAEVTGTSCFLSEVLWEAASTGWGQPARDELYHGAGIRDGVFLELGGTFYEKGLYAHSPSSYTFALDERWKVFDATIGLQDGAVPVGAVVFTVSGDGRELFRSKPLRVGQAEELRISVESVKSLELRTESAGENNHACWSIWASPRLSR